MRIIGIKTNNGYYITDVLENKSYTSSYLSNYVINGEKPTPTFHKLWVEVNDVPKKVQKLQSRPNINYRWELRDESLSDKFEKRYKNEDVFLEYDEDNGNVYTEAFSKIMSLYDFKSDVQTPILVDVEFTYETVQEIEEIKEPQAFSYKRLGDYGKITTPITNSNVKHDIIHEIINPSIALHATPCKLSTQETYDIIRAYVKDNINPKVAEITSDFNFCFTVKKKIKLAKEHIYQVDVNSNFFGGRKKKPKYETRIQKSNSVQVFEMCHAPYQSYTPIKPFQADNEDELKVYIDNYLNHLIEVINEPLQYCEYCNGTGVKVDTIG